MNKLKRALPSSPTKTSSFSAVQVVGTSVSTKLSLDHSRTLPAPQDDVTPRSRVEQYWAARALTAEALLSARTEHHRELRTLSFGEELKRSRERNTLIKVNEDKIARMEKLTWVLLGVIVFLAILIVYVSHLNQRRVQRTQHWRLPAHFTIPILSPFTSVVEHEVSVIGTKTITFSITVIACFAYFVYRHWLVSRIRKE
ncbi:uncharacterized protein BT62DRAFT_927248 [Guyanagaster necrorhizus]|uniref:Uncharacterized protein n=1 Tax=Guyanagaster necrorhizus TaxID=856835 RepID=A0A9P7W2T5_9AGAR|nr:uncharacterized protein BT62DRAFT_927248 [Guyanagaster necrorhizus MCA 3950]KAG7451539.1 hypothetical protein BT62DRAFT_927248 [Guyanagaster necrorhizus MCA 3950]